MSELITHILKDHIDAANSLTTLLDTIKMAGDSCKGAILQGHKVILAGNGGSAADAQHIAAEFVGRFEKDRHAMPAIALGSNVSSITAISNDFGFEEVFARQVSGLGNKGDVFFAITTSGKSPNIIKAAKVAKQKGMIVISMTGSTDDAFNGVADIRIAVSHSNTARIQEMHILVGHMICAIVDE